MLLRSSLIAVLSVACLLIISSCHDNDAPPDVSGIKINLHTRRFDQDIAHLDTNRIQDGLRMLKGKYPDFLDFWMDQLMQFEVHGDYADANPGIHDHLRVFLTHKDFRGLFDTVAVHFPDTKQLDESLRKGFQFYKYYYPSKSTPGIVYFVSGLNNWSAITIDTTLVGVGLDMFLGGNYPFYKSVGIPDYAARNCRPEMVPVAVFRAIYQADHPFVAEGKTLLDMMLQRGKEQYFLSKMIPFAGENARLGFTPDQLAWCNGNESTIYNYFVTANLLYETNWGRIVRYIQEGPQATGMPPQSPGNVGSWIGWRIVSSYAAKHPKMSLDELFAQPDAQTILQESGYKPR